MDKWLTGLFRKPSEPTTQRGPNIYHCGGKYKGCEIRDGTDDMSKLKTVGDYDDGLDMCESCAAKYRSLVTQQGKRQRGGGRRGKRRKSKNRKSIYKGERITKKRTTKRRKTTKRKTKKRKIKTGRRQGGRRRGDIN